MIDFSAAIDSDKKPTGATFAPPAPADPFDLGKVKRRFEIYDPAIDGMRGQAENHEITDDASNAAAVEMAIQAKNLGKEVEAVRKLITEPAFKFKKSVDRFAKNYLEKFAFIEKILRQKMNEYSRIKELERREREKKARRQQIELQKKLDAEAKAKKVEPIKAPEPVIPEAPAVTRTESGSMHTRKQWTWDRANVDFAKVPDEYKTLAIVEINKAVRNGVRHIPGIKIYEDSTTVLR